MNSNFKGCDGTANRFSSNEECQAVCISHSEPGSESKGEIIVYLFETIFYTIEFQNALQIDHQYHPTAGTSKMSVIHYLAIMVFLNHMMLVAVQDVNVMTHVEPIVVQMALNVP